MLQARQTLSLSLFLYLSPAVLVRRNVSMQKKNSRRMYHERMRLVRRARESKKKAGGEGREEVSSLSLLLPPSRLLSTLLARV